MQARKTNTYMIYGTEAHELLVETLVFFREGEFVSGERILEQWITY